MKLTIFNGSPRGKGSNTKLLLDRFLAGMEESNQGWTTELHYLKDIKRSADHLEAFKKAEYLLLAFPLYTDAMPGPVMQFIQQWADLLPLEPKKFGFIVQSGFPEARHSRYVERYLEKLCQRMGGSYLGTVVKGGVEGIQIQPPSMTRKLYARFHQLGVEFGKNASLDQGVIKALAKPETLGPVRRFLFSSLSKTGLTNFYWNKQLKENNAFLQRFARPFDPK